MTLHRQIIHKIDPLTMPDFMVMVPGPTIKIPEVIDCQPHLEPALMGLPILKKGSAQIECPD